MVAPVPVRSPGWELSGRRVPARPGMGRRGVSPTHPGPARPAGLGGGPEPVRVTSTPRPVARPRRRAGALLASAVVTFVVVSGLAVLGQAAPDVPGETAVVRVGAGETVWDVARRVAPGSDPHAVVQRIRELNGMTGSAVEAGGQLRVPDGR